MCNQSPVANRQNQENTRVRRHLRIQGIANFMNAIKSRAVYQKDPSIKANGSLATVSE